VPRVSPRPTIDLKTRERIAANLRLLKHQHRFDTDAAMAAELGMSRSALGRYLKGERTPGLDLCLLVHRRLGVSLDWLVDRDPPREWFDPDYEGPTIRGR
jgi:transcriptional regulator with XRE-family HTH domain